MTKKVDKLEIVILSDFFATVASEILNSLKFPESDLQIRVQGRPRVRVFRNEHAL